MILTDAQLFSEISRCEYCENKPCKTACPCDCSPADFMMALAKGRPSDFKRAAGIILASNPLGGICGNVCPDYHCVDACSHKKFDKPIQIPDVQATIIRKARELDLVPEFSSPIRLNTKIAIVGAGPSAIGAAVTLNQFGYETRMFDPEPLGGQINLISEERLEEIDIIADLNFVVKTFRLQHIPKKIEKPEELLKEGYAAVIVASGLNVPIRLNIPGDETAIYGLDILSNPSKYNFSGKRIAIVGGAIAADIALVAAKNSAAYVEMITLENFVEMPITDREKATLIEAGIEFSPRTRISEIVNENGHLKGIKTKKVYLPKNEKFAPNLIKDEAGVIDNYRIFDMVIIAIGNRATFNVHELERKFDNIFCCGDMVNGPTTVVEAVASGKNTAIKVHLSLSNKAIEKPEKETKSCFPVWGWKKYPVSLETDFFGRIMDSPFILSAAPPTDGFEQMQKAYQAGWSGGIMKTAFDDQDIHIPGEYMFTFGDKKKTLANCDNVSEHSLNRVCKEIARLIKEFPDRLTMASTGGPVTGNDCSDKQCWQSNTKKLEQAGAMGIEFSLSCPQGGDGTKGDIVAQDPVLTAKIVDWVMEISAPEIPKLFKLTGAVTSIYPILSAIKNVLNKYPHKKAGITLANTFPALAFREKEKPWDEGIIVGMSGEGVLPISYLNLARAGNQGIFISGNGGAMNYLDAANFLALGARNVQFCTIVEKYGYNIIEELKMGLSYLLEARGLKSVAELVGIAQPNPIIDFMNLPKKIKSSSLNKELCLKCGNCTRCPYLAIELDEDCFPKIDNDQCVGCSLCTQLCFTGALQMKKI
ncbi:MAG TPA: FAD-dependent oxidoreductase [Candidatus Cloacimonas sp.]|nr:FAD-dependent oxidoreductase [Candidatus Cloacimonas sp.]